MKAEARFVCDGSGYARFRPPGQSGGMEAAARMRIRLTPARHPLAAFLALVLLLSAGFEALGAGLRGGWGEWGEDILWYRASCLINDVLLAWGAWLYGRILGGPAWYRAPGRHPRIGFGLVLLGGAVFLLLLGQRFEALYEDASPPFATGWFSVAHRALAPLWLLSWLRRCCDRTPLPHS